MSHQLDTDTDTDAYLDPDQDWSADLAPHRPANHRAQLFLALLVVLAGGFIGGIVTTQQVEDSQQSSGLPEGIQLPEGVELPEGMQLPDTGSGGVPDASQLAALGGGTPTYTITVVDGSTLYLKNAAGETVKVTTLPTTKVRRLVRASTDQLRPGDTVTVTGDADESGTILAEHVDETG